MSYLVRSLTAPAHLKSRQHAEEVATYLRTRTVIGTDGVLRDAYNLLPISGSRMRLALHLGMPVDRNATNAAARRDASDVGGLLFESVEALAAYLFQHFDLDEGMAAKFRNWTATRSSAQSHHVAHGRDQKGRYWEANLHASMHPRAVLHLRRSEWDAIPPGGIEDEEDVR